MLEITVEEIRDRSCCCLRLILQGKLAGPGVEDRAIHLHLAIVFVTRDAESQTCCARQVFSLVSTVLGNDRGDTGHTRPRLAQSVRRVR